MTPRCKRSLGRSVLWVLLTTMGFAASSVAEKMPEESSRVVSGPRTAILASYDGEWNRVENVDADQIRLESIDAAISDLSWIVRRMVAGVLKGTTSPPTEVAFSWDGAALHQVVDGTNGNFKRAVKFDAEPQLLTDHRGEDFTSEWRWTEAGIEVHWTQSQAFGSNLYQLAGDGSMRIEHRIQVTALDGIGPIVYESTFNRDTLAARQAPLTPNHGLPQVSGASPPTASAASTTVAEDGFEVR